MATGRGVEAKQSRELLAVCFDRKWGALASIIADLNKEAAKIEVELDGIQLRIGRLAITAVVHLKPQLQAKLRSILDALEQRGHNVGALSEGAETLATMLEGVLQDHANHVYACL